MNTVQIWDILADVALDQNPRRKQIFSRMLVESKRLGRTLPAVVNGLSASQAQAQGFVEDVSDADADSTENSESLFVDGDSDNERLKSRPKSASPINKDGLNNDENKLNPTATPFTPSKSQNPLFSSGSNPFQTTTFGKPSINPLTTTAQAKSLPPSKLSFITAAQPSSVPVGDNDPPQFGFFGFQNTNQAEEVIGKATAIGSNEPSKLDLPTAAKTSQLPDFNSSKNSPFVNPPGAKPSVFGQQLNTAPVPLVDPNIVSNQPPTTTVSAPSLPRGIFDKPSGSSAPPTFSFGTSPLFQTVADPTSSKDPDASSSKPNDKSSKSSSTADRPISSMASPAFFAPPKAIINPIVPPSGESTKPSPIDIFNNLDSPSPPTSKPSETSQTKTTSLFANPNSGGLFQPKPSTFPSSPQQSLANPKPNAEESFLPNVATTVPRAANHPAINQNSPSASFQGNRDFQSSSNISSLDSAAQNFPPSLPTRKDDQPSSRPIPLDRLSDAMMLEDNGLLQKFIEFTVEPIIKSSLAQLVDEDSWEEAS